ncbi:ABC transporter permease [Rhodohalobacter barkolensis]|uniref:ABC transporter permease n=1 Tax=Rhodohalobacter barkolensis TaxID=2053187 RepID=A0A2N0VEN4_9BACT|nr:FtsX-like permease family protein [Rhodohalobacter barkolensis]PKD42649.1 ABC transporter permease [Rhodohalobacter barkolensis]
MRLFPINSTNTKIALVHLTSRLKQLLVAVLSVTFGISMYIFLNGFLNGVNDTQTELAFSTMAHIRIYNDLPEDKTNLLEMAPDNTVAVNIRNPRVIKYTEGIQNADQYVRVAERQPEVKAVSKQVNINIFYRNGAIQVNGQLSGVDVASEDKLFDTSKYVTSGSWENLSTRSNGIVLGKGLARKLSLNMGDRVQVTTADGLSKSYEIVGLLETSIISVDNSKGYIRISSARQLLSKNMSYVTDIQVNVRDFNKSEQTATTLSRVIPYKVEPWMEASGQLEAGSELRDILGIAVSLTILLVAGFGIYNIMNMTVNEKIKEIAILKAMGFDGDDIVEIFLTQSVIIGLLGGIVGMAFGYVVSRLINNIPFNVAGLEVLPMTYNLDDYGLAFMFGLITTFIAGYLPARKAASIDPVEIIRG